MVSISQSDPPTISHLFPAGAQRGSTSIVTMQGEFPWPVKIWSPGIDITCQDDEGKLKIAIPYDLAPDRVWFRIYNEDGASTMQPFLVGSLPEGTEAEPNESPSEPQDLSKTSPPPNDANLTINGTLQKDHDVDCFAFHLSAGQTVVASLDANEAFGSPMDAILQIVDPAGIVVAENHDDVGLDPRLAFTAPKTGKYIARLFAFPAKPDQTIRFRGGKAYVYRLTLTTRPFITHAVPLTATLGATTTHEVRGWNIKPNTLLPSRPSDSILYQTQDDESKAPRVIRGAGWAGRANLEVVDFESFPNEVVTTEQNPLSITPSIALTGCIHEPNHTDHFRVLLQKNRPYTFRLDSVSLYSHLVAHIKLVDPKGNVATESSVSSAATDVSLNYTPKADGEYFLTVADRYDHGGFRHFYRLVVQETLADFQLSVEADRFTLTSDKPLEISVTVSRTNGESKNIESIRVEALDLPAGVTCEAVDAESNGDSAKKVTLKLVGKQHASGPIRIRGTASNGDVRFARSPEIHQVRFQQFWLTAKTVEAEGSTEE